MYFKNASITLLALVGFSGACAQIVQKPLKIINYSKRPVRLTVMSPKKTSGSKVTEWYKLRISVPPRQESGQTTKTFQFIDDDDLPVIYKIKKSGRVSQLYTLSSFAPVEGLSCDIDEPGNLNCSTGPLKGLIYF